MSAASDRLVAREDAMEPEEVDAILDQANRLLAEGRPEDSLRCLDDVGPDGLGDEDRIEWTSLRAWALSDMGRDQDALDALDQLLEEFPQSSRLLGTLGVVLSNGEALDDARQALEDALAIDPQDEVALANLALVYEKLREYPRALELYDRALGLGADLDWVLQHKASVLTECAQYAEAKATMKRYLSLAPDDASQWIALGILHSDDQEYTEAFNCYRQAERVEPDSPSLRLNWGVTAVRARELSVAYAQLAYLKQLEPRSTRWWLLRAFILEEERDLRGARDIYDRILRRTRFADRAELSYALEMAMDFFSRHRHRQRCERLLQRAYADNACTVELCEAYREAIGEQVAKAYWFSLMVEADYRAGLCEIHNGPKPKPHGYTRFARNYQVVARDHDEAVSLVLDVAKRMGEQHLAVREFVGSEPIDDTYTGLYEVEADSFVFAEDTA